MAKGMRAAWWWIDRWRKSTAKTDMTLAEQGAYRNLIDELWLRDGLLPDDGRAIAQASGDAVEWPKVQAKVMAHFIKVPGGYRHETHDEISGKSRFLKSQSDKGKKGAAARWGDRHEDTPAIDPGIPPANTPATDPANAPGYSPPIAFRLRTPSPSMDQDPTNDNAPPSPPAEAGGELPTPTESDDPFEVAEGLDSDNGHDRTDEVREERPDPYADEPKTTASIRARVTRLISVAAHRHGYRFDRDARRKLMDRLAGGETDSQVLSGWQKTQDVLKALDEAEDLGAMDEVGED